MKPKSIKWNIDDERERKVWEWLRTLPHGQFTKETKEYWMKRYEEVNKEGLQ